MSVNITHGSVLAQCDVLVSHPNWGNELKHGLCHQKQPLITTQLHKISTWCVYTSECVFRVTAKSRLEQTKDSSSRAINSDLNTCSTAFLIISCRWFIRIRWRSSPQWRAGNSTDSGAGWWYFTLKEQVFLGPASALLWGNIIFHILTFRNIVHDVKVVDRCLATTPLVSWQQVDKCDWSAPQPIKKHVHVEHNDAWGQLKDTLPSIHELTLVHM